MKENLIRNNATQRIFSSGNYHSNNLEITYYGFTALFKYADDSTIVAPALGNTDTSVRYPPLSCSLDKPRLFYIFSSLNNKLSNVVLIKCGSLYHKFSVHSYFW